MNTTMPNRFNRLSEEEWYEIAPQAVGVGRWMWNMTQNECSLDSVAKSITGLWEKADTFPAKEYLDTIHPVDRERVKAAIDAARKKRVLYDAQYRIRNAKGDTIWVDGRGKFITSEAGDEILIGVLLDVSELMAARERNELLVHEMAHRVKNSLSLVSGIFRMAVRSSKNIEELERAFLGRIQALGTLNDLTLKSETRSATVKEIASEILASLDNDFRVEMDIDHFVLNGPGAQTLCLTLNELLTNAIKYGALSEKGGSLKISMKHNPDANRFYVEWNESVQEEISPPTKTSGFGLRVLMKMTRSTFKGRPNLKWDKNGMTFDCVWSASEIGL
jgi:two-component sensor histidine kinase